MLYHNGDNTLIKLASVAKEASKHLRGRRKEFDCIAVRGVSGLVVGAPVAISISKPLVIVRKPSEECHAWERVVNYRPNHHKAVFLDDFRGSGNTERWTRAELHRVGITVTHCFFYRDMEWRNPLLMSTDDLDKMRAT